MIWRTASFVLGAACAILLYRDCTHTCELAPTTTTNASVDRTQHAAAGDHAWQGAGEDPQPAPEPPLPPGAFGFAGFQLQVPGWAFSLAPRPGENLLAYRDRILPLAQAAVAPQRARVAQSRDDFAAAAHLDAKQRAVLDAATQEAASAIEERVLGAALSGDFSPQTFKPMTAVTAARDVLDAIDSADKKFLATLSDSQRAQLAEHPFDFADYLMFSTRWEDALGLTN